jgi:hypothetical protein
MSKNINSEIATTIDTSESQTDAHSPPHPVADAIDRYLHSTRDLSFAARAFIPAAEHIKNEQRERLNADFDRAEALMAEADLGNRARGIKLAFASTQEAKRLKYSKLPQQIESSLFVNLFSSFDVFTGELISALHTQQPELFRRLKRSIPLSTVLAASSLEMLKTSVLDEEIETFRRKSYAEQFDYLETTFGINLRNFEKWPDFVEAGQRRNLLTHCGGVVSEQYRSVCIKEGYTSGKLLPIGATLSLGPEYFLPTCELMHEVGLKLGQTLWRKVLPNDIEIADTHLNGVVYEALSQEQWKRAETAGEFFSNQTNLSSDLRKRMAIINYAIALKYQEKLDEMKKILMGNDWSATIPEFRLAEAVLLERTEDACKIIRSIGAKGQIIEEHSYHSWPLFRDLREEPKFHEAYESVYGYPFMSEVQRVTREERNAIADRTSDVTEVSDIAVEPLGD